jgi:putative endopeptidase
MLSRPHLSPTEGKTPSVPSVDTSIDPGADFYKYVNNKWQRHVHLPPFQASYGVSEEIEDQVKTQLLTSIEEERERRPADPLSMLATSFLNTRVQHSSIHALNALLNRFDCITSIEGVGSFIGHLNRIQSMAPLSFVISMDTFDNSKCNVYLHEPQMNLPSLHYYMPGKRDGVLTAYMKFLTLTGRLFAIDNLPEAYLIEMYVIPYLATADLADPEQSYFPVTIGQLKRRYKAIPWDPMLTNWGMHIDRAKDVQFIITNPRYLRGLNTMFRKFSLENWRVWMRSMVITSFVEYLPPPYDDIHAELFGRAIRGKVEKLPQKYLTLAVLGKFAPQDLSKLYVDQHVDKKVKSYVTYMVQQLLVSTVERLREVAWMQSETRNKAIEKVRQMKYQVAYPDSWTSETTNVVIDPTTPLENIFQLCMNDSKTMINEVLKGKCEQSTDIWSDGAFEVNAYYYQQKNMLVVPAGMCISPFLDLRRSDAWNLGGLGSAIGHEITHGFDADGRMYDAKGNYKNWWTPKDAEHYETVADTIYEAFDGLSYFGGKVDGELTLDENIADIGGLAIALHTLQKGFVGTSDAEKKQAYKDFFTSFAVSWRQKDRAKKAKHALKQDRHAPPLLRVNMVVRQFEEFYTAFDIPLTHKNLIPAEERVRLW